MPLEQNESLVIFHTQSWQIRLRKILNETSDKKAAKTFFSGEEIISASLEFHEIYE